MTWAPGQICRFSPEYNGCLQAVIPLEKLRDFIAFARAQCQPELSDEAAQDLVHAYQTMRNQGMGRNTISATPRQLESMIRLSEGLARMRLSSTVERHDVAEAVRLMKVSKGCSVCMHDDGGPHSKLCWLLPLLADDVLDTMQKSHATAPLPMVVT